jgi:hypothetical protein
LLVVCGSKKRVSGTNHEPLKANHWIFQIWRTGTNASDQLGLNHAGNRDIAMH